MNGRAAQYVGLGAALWLSTGCLVSDELCDRNRVELEGRVTGCVCAPGTVPDPDNKGCSPCAGENEQAVNGVCDCVAGFRRMAGVCAPIVDSGASESDGTAPTGPLTGTAGQDAPCASAAQCEGQDATFCMTIAPMPVCLVQNCSNGMRRCADDRVCCDLSALSTLLPALATANGLCIPAAGCSMAGGQVVAP